MAKTQAVPTRYRSYGMPLVPDPEGQWVHVKDLGVTSWALDPLSRYLPDKVRSARLAAAILNVGISGLDWHVSQIVKGEDEAATTLADLILEALADNARLERRRAGSGDTR